MRGRDGCLARGLTAPNMRKPPPKQRSSRRRSALAVMAALLAGAAPAGCGRSGVPVGSGGLGAGPGGRLLVAAAENFWGSIATQLGGEQVSVTSIITNPNVDPHSYEPDAQDARTLAGAQVAIVNGIGYDNWAGRLLGASPLRGRAVLDVGSVLHLKSGQNPHQWYSPSNVRLIAQRITATYQRLQPSHAGYFAERERVFLGQRLARYDRLLAEIRSRYAGVPVGYSESIFEPLGQALGLKLMTPYGFAKAIAEGTDVTAQDKRTVDAQAQMHRIKVWVFNTQNVTPDVARVTAIARQERIPVATVTETLAPASDSFQQWQVSELEGLLRALREGTGR